MALPPISRYPVPALQDLRDDIRVRIPAFAMQVAQAPHAIRDADWASLRGPGFSDEDIWDVGAIAGFFALSSRMANMIGMHPNDEFYLMGRLPEQ